MFERSVALALVRAVCTSCSHQLEGATPAPGLADPQIVCDEQLTKTLVLTGDRFSPTVFEALTDHEKVILPKVPRGHTRCVLRRMARVGEAAVLLTAVKQPR